MVLALAVTFAGVPARARAGDEAARGARRSVVDPAPVLLGQAVDWLDDEHVVWQDPTTRDEDGDGQIQIHRSTLDGSEKVCLTCGLEGPNQVPAIVDRLSGVRTILQVPFDLPNQIRDQAVDLLRDPKSFSFHGRGCGGDAADGRAALVQETRIGRYAE
jgi:predicted NBD/HSP70 family sugar kinase